MMLRLIQEVDIKNVSKAVNGIRNGIHDPTITDVVLYQLYSLQLVIT